MDDELSSLQQFLGGALVGSVFAVPVCLLLEWAVGGLARWWWLWPAAATISVLLVCVVATLWRAAGEVPEPPPRKSKLPPSKTRKPRRPNLKVVDLAIERARRAGGNANG